MNGAVVGSNFSINISNVVSSFKLKPPLVLEEIHSAFEEESIFDESVFNFGVVVLRHKEPKMSFLIYRTGSVICTGTNNIKYASNCDEYLLHLFKRSGLSVSLISKPKIRNIVAVTDLRQDLDLDEISRVLKNVEYEPEQFPGAIYRVHTDSWRNETILLFRSGKIVCVGFKRVEDIKAAVGSFLLRFRSILASPLGDSR